MATFQRLGHRVGQKYNFSVALIFYVISTLHYFIDRNMVFKFHTLVFKNLSLYSDRKQKINKQTQNLISIDTGVVNSLLKCVLTHFIYPSKSEFFYGGTRVPEISTKWSEQLENMNTKYNID